MSGQDKKTIAWTMIVSGGAFFGFLLVFGSTLFYLKFLVFLSLGYIFVGILILQSGGDGSRQKLRFERTINCNPRRIRQRQREEFNFNQRIQAGVIPVIHFGRSKKRF